MKRIAIFFVAVLALLLSVADVYAAPITIIDQQNVGPNTGTNGNWNRIWFGQSFTPTLSRIDAIEVLMWGENDTVTAQILDGIASFDGLGGTVIASSDPVFVNVPSGLETIHFDFPLGVNLTPGQTYVARVNALGVGWSGDSYGAGQFLHGGYAIADMSARDLVFTEGLTSPVPEPATVCLFSLGLAAFMGYRKAKAKS